MTSLLINGPVTVPADFMGTQSKWPQGGGTKPAMNIKAHRVHDTNSPWRWYQIETSAGVYSWTQMDALITQQRTQGWSVMMNTYGTPAFYTTNSATDSYGVAGAASYPDLDTNLVAWKAFVTTMITRYNDPSGAWRIANPTLGKGIQYLETWNEPEVTGSYWKGTAAQYADLTLAAYDAAKAVDPALPVICGGFLNVTKSRSFWGVYGALYPARKFEEGFDHIAYHTYIACPYGAPYQNYFSDCLMSEAGLMPYIKLAKKYKPTAKFYCTELGFSAAAGNDLTAFNAESASLRYTHLGRILLTLAAAGVQGVYTYGWAWTFCGDFVNDTSGVRLAVDTVAQIAGRTIVSATQAIGGALTVVCADGFTLTI